DLPGWILMVADTAMDAYKEHEENCQKFQGVGLDETSIYVFTEPAWGQNLKQYEALAAEYCSCQCENDAGTACDLPSILPIGPFFLGVDTNLYIGPPGSTAPSCKERLINAKCLQTCQDTCNRQAQNGTFCTGDTKVARLQKADLKETRSGYIYMSDGPRGPENVMTRCAQSADEANECRQLLCTPPAL